MWRLQRSLVPENEDHGLDVGEVQKKWKWHEGAWYHDLWVKAEKRLVLSSMESARVLSLQGGLASGSRDRERSRSPTGREQLDIDSL